MIRAILVPFRGILYCCDIQARVCCGQTAGWIKMPCTGIGRPGPRPQAPPPKRGTSANFRPISIVAKWSPISATAEHLLISAFSPPRLQFLLGNTKQLLSSIFLIFSQTFHQGLIFTAISHHCRIGIN